MRRPLVLLALLGACAFDGSGTRAGLDDGADDDEVAADAGRGWPSADPDPARTPPPDAGPVDDDVGAPDAAPPDAPEDDDEDACGGFGQACCDEEPRCEALLGCLGGTCL